MFLTAIAPSSRSLTDMLATHNSSVSTPSIPSLLATVQTQILPRSIYPASESIPSLIAKVLSRGLNEKFSPL
ncbi:hypothetical protein [Fischerella thermalis]|uniref:hypothetical protein n=1 Tax=Fischerella thermalis TaxID=372787 RepID=UPI0011AF8D96|nr:hypothetical protein [Fischerella thermalis]